MKSRCLLTRTIEVLPKHLGNIDEYLIKYLKDNVEKSYIPGGGFVTDIISIQKRSKGKLDNNSLNGTTQFNVVYECNVINLENNMILAGCNIDNVSPPGIFLNKDGIIDIFVKQSLLKEDVEYKVNQKINVMVKTFQSQVAGEKLVVLGSLDKYALQPFENRIVMIPDPEDIDKIKIRIEMGEDRDSMDNLCELGFDMRVEETKKLIDKIGPDIWRYYRGLLNPYELVSDNKNKNKIVSRAYYKLWEIMNIFPNLLLTGGNEEGKKILALCEAPGGFVKAILDFRENKKDEITAISMTGDGVIEFNGDLKKHKQVKVNPVKGCNCDITDHKVLAKCLGSKGLKKGGYDLITADGGIMEDVFEEEKDTIKLKVAECLMALEFQAVGGSFVIKLFDTCTRGSADLIMLLRKYYDEVILFKPELSRPGNGERYCICSGFKGTSPGELAKLYKILDNKDRYVIKIFEDNNKVIDDSIRLFNNKMLGEQYRKLNEIIDNIKVNDFKKLPAEQADEYIKEQKRIADDWLKSMKLV